MTVNDFMKVCDYFTLRVNYVCDSEEIQVNAGNYSEILETAGDIEIKSISIDYDKNENRCLLVETVPNENEII